MYIDFKSISAAWELGPGIFCAKVGPSVGPNEIKMAFEVSIDYVWSVVEVLTGCADCFKLVEMQNILQAWEQELLSADGSLSSYPTQPTIILFWFGSVNETFQLLSAVGTLWNSWSFTLEIPSNCCPTSLVFWLDPSGSARFPTKPWRARRLGCFMVSGPISGNPVYRWNSNF